MKERNMDRKKSGCHSRKFLAGSVEGATESRCYRSACYGRLRDHFWRSGGPLARSVQAMGYRFPVKEHSSRFGNHRDVPKRGWEPRGIPVAPHGSEQWGSWDHAESRTDPDGRDLDHCGRWVYGATTGSSVMEGSSTAAW